VVNARTHTNITLIILLGVALLVTLPTATANVGACEIRSSCGAEETAIASVSAPSNAHAAPLNYDTFTHVLCCNQDIFLEEGPLTIQPMITIADDNGQGHVSGPGVFPQEITGNWNSCQVVTGACNFAEDEQCLAKISEAGTINGQVQGHIYSCSDTTSGLRSVCCCPTRTQPNGFGGCQGYSTSVFIEEIDGPTHVQRNTPMQYRALIDWGVYTHLQYRFFQRAVGSSITTGSWITEETFMGRENFTAPVSFHTTTGDREVCVQARATEVPNDIKIECMPVTVYGEEQICNLDNCQVINSDYVAQACSATGAPIFVGAYVNYTHETSLFCTNPALDCLCGKCMDGYIQDPFSGLCVVDESHPLTHTFTIEEASSPQLTHHTNTSAVGQAPLTIEFLLNASVQRPLGEPTPNIIYTLNVGNGTTITYGGTSTVLHYYPPMTFSPGFYNSTMTVTAGSETQTSSVTINSTNNPPVIHEFSVEPTEGHPIAQSRVTIRMSSATHKPIIATITTIPETHTKYAHKLSLCLVYI